MLARLQVGTLLIASLDLEDPNFCRTVVLLVQYSQEDGAVGLVLNRPLGEKLALYSNEQLQRLTGVEEAIHNVSPQIISLFFEGGPVEPGYLFFLHRLDSLTEPGMQICSGVYLGGDLEAVRAEAAVLDVADPALRFYLGYAGWQAGQLEAEIDIGAWYLCPSRAELILDASSEDLWQRALYSLGGKYRALSFIPEDPTVN